MITSRHRAHTSMIQEQNTRVATEGQERTSIVAREHYMVELGIVKSLRAIQMDWKLRPVT